MPSFWRIKPRDNTVVDNLGQVVAGQAHDSVINSIQTGEIRLNHTDRHGRTILHWAAILGKRQLVMDLLEKNVEIGATDWLGQSALHYAIQREDVDMLSALLNSKHYNEQEEQRRDASGRSLLHCALDSPCFPIISMCMVPRLISLPDFDERTPLHYAVIRGYGNAAKRLLEIGTDINSQDGKGWTALHYAARVGWEAMIMELMELGADVTMKDHKGRRAGHRAAENGHRAATVLLLGDDKLKLERAEILTLLVQNMLDIDKVDAEGDTLLHWATKHGQTDAIDAILKRLRDNGGSSMGQLNGALMTPLHLILGNEEPGGPISNAMLRHLVETVAVEGWIQTALRRDDTVILEAVLRYLEQTGASADVTFRSNPHDPSTTLLDHAVCSVRPDDANMLKLLLRHLTQSGNTAYMESQHYQRRTPLHIAAEYGDEATMGLMLRQIEQVGAGGIVTMMEDMSGSTPLHIACAECPGVAELMLPFYMKTVGNACLNHRDRRGRKPIDCATDAKLKNLLQKAMSLSESASEIGHGMPSSSGTTMTITKPQ